MSKVILDIDIKQALKNLEQIEKDIMATLNDGIRSVADATYSYAQKLANSRLNTSKNIYLDNLHLTEVAKDFYLIYINENSKAPMFEEGFNSYNMRASILNSKSKISQKGHRYKDIPFNINIQKKKSTSPRINDIRSAVKQVIKDKELLKNAKQYTRIVNGQKAKITRFQGLKNKNIEGLTRVKVGNRAKYFLFRRISENPKTPNFNQKWNHTGFAGINIFENELPKFVNLQMKKMLNDIFK